MRIAIAVVIGGGLGSLARYWTSSAMARFFGAAFPWGTLAVNVAGCALMGFLATWAVERAAWPPEARLFATTGLLGGFTTFSAFSHETLRLAEGGEFLRAAVNITATLMLSLLAVWIGTMIARELR